MKENDQILFLIKMKGKCVGHSTENITCHCCIADTFCKPEEDDDVVNTRYKYAISLGIKRNIIPESYLPSIFEELL